MHDYVIVGAGSAGCVLAARLSEDPSVRVLLLEAGAADRSLNIAIPAAFAKQFHTKLDWDLATEPEPHVDGRPLYIPRGKGIGGSSSMNAMLYVRGRDADYDGWAAQGAPGWSAAEVLPYFTRPEDNVLGAGPRHGVGGPMRVEEERSPRRVSRRIEHAFVAAGVPPTDDYNDGRADGVRGFQVTQKRGRRWSAANAFLHPVMGRPNLEVRRGATALSVELEAGRATGVWVAARGGGRELVRAQREVILSAGAIHSPALLQRSGIGPAQVLGEAGIAVRHELAGVGENLQDHPFLTVLWEVDDPGTLRHAEKPRYLAEWALRRTGPLTSTIAEVCAYVRSSPGLEHPDLQFHAGAAYFDDHGAAEYDGDCAVIAPVLVNPRSRGRLWLRSGDPHAAPAILTNTLAEQADRDALVAGIELAREIAGHQPLREVITKEIKPGPAARDRAAIEADLRQRLMLLYHPVGTCRMSDTAEGAVVDAQLRVHGIEALRVVDASVMPTIPSGNTNAPTIMIAEKAADLIRGRAPLPAAALAEAGA